MLQTCLNGGRGKPAPSTPEDIAQAAVGAVNAGAEELHIHPRDTKCAESHSPEDLANRLREVREAVPGVPAGIGTGVWNAPGSRARHARIEAWSTLPDYVSVNLGEEDAPEVIGLVHRKGIGIEVGIWCQADAACFASLGVAAVHRVLVEMSDISPEAATNETEAVLEQLPDGLSILLHGDGVSAWPMLELAVERGQDMRVGFEDVTRLPNGDLAQNNADLVGAACELCAAE